MSWLEAIPVLLVAAAILVLPGYAVTRALSLRGLWAWGVAGPASVSVVVLASLGAGLLGIPWSVLPVLVTTVALGVVGFVVARLSRGRKPIESARLRSRQAAMVAGAFTLAAILFGFQIALVVGAPENISQTFDNVFHLNAVRYILDTENASPMSVGGMTSAPGVSAFYPAAWHSIVALVVQLTGASIMVATNVVTIVTAAVVWPATVVLLTMVLFGKRLVLLLSAVFLSGLLPAFPLMLVDYGVLYPYLLGVSLVPAALAAVIQLVRLHRENDSISSPVLILVILGLIPGIAVAHPGALVAWIILGMLVASVAFIGFLRSRPERRRVIVFSVTFGLLAVASVAAWRVLRPPAEARGWPTEQSVSQALGQALTLSPRYSHIPVLVTVLFIIGLIVVARRRRHGDGVALVLMAAVVVLFVVASALPLHPLRDLITAAWYNNAPRLAALIPIIAVPLAAVGTTAVLAWVRGRLRQSPVRRGALVGSAALALLLLAGQVMAMAQAMQSASGAYQYSETAPLVSTDERDLLERLPGEVPADALIIGSPWTGTGMAYAFAGRDVVMPHILMGVTPDEQEIMDELSRSGSAAKVCQAVERSGVDYVLDFGSQEIHGAEHRYRGLERLSRSDLVTMIDSEGDAVLYKITGCD
ncbi:hypothetical protein SRABI76_00271 [Microbacterium oxydans]|uniref:DUF6541 family protein n=1 Tax=Microbacterium oxydans TaxID=82380 RepID=UPI001D717ACA|nr:DUF6541 family protein [Microbacterium oxydans]CAH0129908.1 hypothetical protein SRABI76_00271 [Microbacterium oxydans]